MNTFPPTEQVHLPLPRGKKTMCKTPSVLEFPNILHLSFPWHLNPIVIQVFIASKIHSEILVAESDKPTLKGGWVSHCGALVFLSLKVCLMGLYQNQPVVEADAFLRLAGSRRPLIVSTHLWRLCWF